MLAILKTALRAIRRNILRSFLTMLGIIVGISAVIVGVSMGAGARAEVEKQIASMGNNLLIVFSGNMSRGGVRGGFGSQPSLTERDYETLRREVSGVVGDPGFLHLGVLGEGFAVTPVQPVPVLLQCRRSVGVRLVGVRECSPFGHVRLL